MLRNVVHEVRLSIWRLEMSNVINFDREKRYIRAKDIVKMFGVARSTVDNWAKYGYLTRHKIGRNIFYDVSEIELLKGAI